MITFGSYQIEVRPEFELLLRCARTELCPLQRDRIATLAQQPLAWEWLADVASRHRLTPFIHRHLTDVAPGRCPAPLRRAWEEETLRVIGWNMRLVNELAAVAGMLRESQIPLLCLKGPALDAAYYGNRRLRLSVDLDLLVRSADVQRAGEQLRRRGFQPQFELSRRWWPVFLRRFVELAFSRESPSQLIELHWGLHPPGYSLTPSCDAVWDRAELVLVDKCPVQTLGPEDNLQYLCLHAARHNWQKLIWLVDIAELVRQRPSLDWERVLSPITPGPAGRPLRVSLLMAAKLLDGAIPGEIVQRFAADHDECRIAAQAARAGFLDEQQEPLASVEYPWRSLYFKALGTRRDKLRLLHDVLLQPTPLEWQLVPLPAWLAPLHYAVRPWRLLWRALLRRCRIVASIGEPEMDRRQSGA